MSLRSAELFWEVNLAPHSRFSFARAESADIFGGMLRRNAFWLVAPVALIVAVVGGFLLFESVWGDSEWEVYVREARLHKIKLTVPEILPEWPPDEDNFGTAPLFHVATAPNGTPLTRRFALPDPRFTKSLSSGDVDKCRQVDLRAWRKRFVASGWSSNNESLSDARAILEAMERIAPDLVALREAAQRTQCRFPVNWNDPLQAQMPHVTMINGAREVLTLRGEALLKEERSSDVLNDIRLLLTLAHRMDREPGISSSIMLYAYPIKDACYLVWSGICADSWDSDSLSQIEAELKKLNVIGNFRWALESGRALQNATYDRLATSNVFARMELASGGRPTPLGSTAQVLRSFYMGASVQRNRLRTNRYIDDLLEQIDERDQLYIAKVSPWEPTDQTATKHSVLQQMQLAVSDLLDGSYPSVFRHALRLHTRVQHARIACALERYRLSRGMYPEGLDALVPDYLPEIPHDVCDGAPMRYRLDPSRRYILHAIGTDQKDDGGLPPDPKSSKQNADWVWTYPAR